MPAGGPLTQALQRLPRPQCPQDGLGSLGFPECAWLGIVHPAEEALSKDFQWRLHFGATLLVAGGRGGVLELVASSLCSSSQYRGEGVGTV